MIEKLEIAFPRAIVCSSSFSCFHDPSGPGPSHATVFPVTCTTCNLQSLPQWRVKSLHCRPLPSWSFILCCTQEHLSSSNGDSRKQGENLFRMVSFIGVLTVLSKFIGLLREALLAAVYGVGPIANAFSYSLILPTFFLAILGGINGPLHVTMVSILSKRRPDEREVVIGKVSAIVGLICASLSIAILVFASPIIDTTAPGMLLQGSQTEHSTRNLAILQLKIMSPCALLAGLIGLGYGSLSTSGIHGVASVSPMLSSLFVMFAAGLHVLRTWPLAASQNNLMEGASLLALGVTIGAFAQWLWQGKAQCDSGLVFLRFSPVNPFKDKELHKVLELLLPAVVGSGLLQFATLTDLYFASFITGAAAALGYANLLVLAPLGVVSSSLLVPMLSIFSRLTEPSKWIELKHQIGQGLFLVMVTTLPMAAILVSLSHPIVEIVFQRLAFDSTATALVSSLLVCYAMGAPFYVAKDILTQVFYALGDSCTPFAISLTAIFTNAFLDWLLMRFAGLGSNGLVLATVIVNAASAIMLLSLLSRKLSGLPIKMWAYWNLILVGASCLCGVVAQVSYRWFASFPYLRNFGTVCAVLLSSLLGMSAFLAVMLLININSQPLGSFTMFHRYELTDR